MFLHFRGKCFKLVSCNRESVTKKFGYLIACPLSNCLYLWCISLTFPSHFWWYICVHRQRCQMCYMALICEFNHSVLLKWEQHWPLLQEKGFFLLDLHIQESSYDRIYATYQVMDLFSVFIKKHIRILCLFHSLIVCPWKQMGFSLANCWLCRNSPDAKVYFTLNCIS